MLETAEGLSLTFELLEMFGKGELSAMGVHRLAKAAWRDGLGRQDKNA